MRKIEVVVARTRAERMRALRAAVKRMLAVEPDGAALIEPSDVAVLRSLGRTGHADAIRFVYGDLGAIRSAEDLTAIPERADAILVVAGERLADELRAAAFATVGNA